MTKIILVEDDLTNVGLIKMLLELDGFTVVACTDRQQAEQAAQQTDVGAFIIDQHLPRGESGLALLQKIRWGKTAVSTHTPVIMTSGDDRCAAPAHQAGASAFLLKPYPPATLSATLQAILAEEAPSD